MKKGKILAVAAAALVGQLVGKGVTVVAPENVEQIKKEISVSKDRKKKKEKSGFIEPAFPSIAQLFPAHTSPFFNPTKSQRVKNKLNRKYYK